MINVSINDHYFVRDVLTNNKDPIAYNGKTVTLFWSGGVDSTYMLFWLLAHGYEVHTIYCELENNSFKVKRENLAREKIRNWTIANVPSVTSRWHHRKEPISRIKISSGDFRACLAQAPLWLVNTQFIGGELSRELPRTYVMAYVNGDDALYWIPAFNKIVEGYNMLAKDGHDITVLFPLASMKKAWFYEALQPIYGLMTWCEYHVLKKNCKCPACVRHRHELSVFEQQISK